MSGVICMRVSEYIPTRFRKIPVGKKMIMFGLSSAELEDLDISYDIVKKRGRFINFVSNRHAGGKEYL